MTAGSGALFFARYAYAPNQLGYCGPARPETLLDCVTTGADAGAIRAIARGFHGAWPYLEILARLAGVADPLDRRVVEAYWLGGGVGDTVGAGEFGDALLAHIKPQAGHYWKHLTPELVGEAAPNHCFHVFGVYPWSRLLGALHFEQPLHVLDNCRIRWGTVLERDGDHVVVRNRRLTWDGGRLGLSEPRVDRAAVAAEGRTFLPGVEPGERVALHWDRTCDRLTAEQVERLRRTTLAQIEATNRRLACHPGPGMNGGR
ncbi:DUF6390 family protein [Sphaerisporangium sp. NPDC051011]|uniref:DUF6390 family protein n=1 Tax=Sphaerisporangium sp. NPDC051011 TaxID=3155792 RepID=UPI0033DB8271